MTTGLDLEIAKGAVGGFAVVNKFGRVLDLDDTDDETVIWPGGLKMPELTLATVVSIVSSSPGDHSSGQGLKTMRIFGLNSTFALQQEDITLTGATAVLTTKKYMSLYRAYGLTGGTDGNFEGASGNISLVATDTSATMAYLVAGDGQTHQAFYQIPFEKTGYLLQYYASVNRKQTTGAVDILIRQREDGGVWRDIHTRGVQVAGSNTLAHTFSPPIKLNAKTKVKACAISTVINSDISAGFDILLIDD